MIVSFLRHGQAQSPGFAREDKDRELTAAGIAAVQTSALKMDIPKKIFSSDAERCKMTVAALTGALNHEVPVEFHPELYTGHVETYFNFLKKCENHYLLVGHNPVIEDLISQIINRPVHIRPGTLTVIDIELGQRLQDTKGVILNTIYTAP